MVEAFYPVLADGGVMINFSSVAAYTMSKKFVIYFTQKNVARFVEKHCRILSISPGCYLTPMHQKLIDNQPETAENQLDLIPAGRWGHPYEMGALTAFLCSPRSWLHQRRGHSRRRRPERRGFCPADLTGT